jgi:HSP20 family protein
MAVVRWDPWSELASLQRDVSGIRAGDQRLYAGIPPIDAYRTADGLVVNVELPGMHKEDVDVSVQDGVLTVSGERKAETTVNDEDWVRTERTFGSFERSFTLPEGTDPDGISASFDSGVLTLTVPAPTERQPRKIEVSETAEA